MERSNEVIFGFQPTAGEQAALDGFRHAVATSNDSGDELRDRLHRAWRISGELADDPAIVGLRARLRVRSGDRRRAGMAGIAAALAVGIGVSALYLSPISPFHPVADGTQVASAAGERRAVRLVDGTRVVLDGRTRLRATITASERRIELLAGRALFDVRHEDRPFRVLSAGGETLDLGTRFVVDSDGRTATVTLIAGRVRVMPGADGARHELRPGELIRYAAGQTIGPAAGAGQDPLGWIAGRLTFDETPLAEALAQLSRYSARPIVADAALAGQHRVVTGTFMADRHDDAVQAIAAALGLRVETGADGGRILRE